MRSVRGGENIPPEDRSGIVNGEVLAAYHVSDVNPGSAPQEACRHDKHRPGGGDADYRSSDGAEANAEIGAGDLMLEDLAPSRRESP
jgi:hypothetical protein